MIEAVVRNWRWVVGAIVFILMVGGFLWLNQAPPEDKEDARPTYTRPTLPDTNKGNRALGNGLDGEGFDDMLSGLPQGGPVKVTVTMKLSGSYAGFAYGFRGGKMTIGSGASFSMTKVVAGRPGGLIAGLLYPGGSATCSVSVNGVLASSNSGTAGTEGRWVYCMG